MGFVYKITCLTNKKLYIGSTTRLLCQRWGDHKSTLRSNTHSNIHLQRAWNKYGEKSFVFEEIEKINNEMVLEREQFWMDYYNVYKEGFNRNPFAKNSYGIKRTEEQRRNNGATGNWKKANAAWKGSTHTPETRQTIKEKRASQKMKPWTTESRKKLSESLKKLYQDGKMKRGIRKKDGYIHVLAYNNKELLYFKTSGDAAKYYKLNSVNGITRVLRKERKSFMGYKWKALVKSGEFMESLGEGNHELSLVKSVKVAKKVQRLESDELKNNLSTSARQLIKLFLTDDIV